MRFSTPRAATAASLCSLALLAPAVAQGQSASDSSHPGAGNADATQCNDFTDRLPVPGDKRAVSPSAPNPLAGEKWYLDTKRSRFGHKGFREPAYGEYRSLGGRQQALMAKIALTPRFFWFGRFSGDSLDPERGLDDLRLRVCTFLADAERENAVPLITVMRHTGGECNPTYQAGGVREDDATRRWYDAFADAVGNSRAIIAYEPDSIGTVDCLARSRRDDRIRLLRDGIDRLSKLPNATIYIEATASDWRPVSDTVSKLRRIGVHKVRGFMLNVTHVDWTAANMRYGRAVSKRLGGKHFIINTATNGRGPVHFKRRIGSRNRTIVINCHPLFRGLGPTPTTQTGDRLVDAFMWISRPGYSSGSCNGGPRVGDWWLKRALQLAQYGTQRKTPAKGTRFGFPIGKVTPRQVAGTQFLVDKFD